MIIPHQVTPPACSRVAILMPIASPPLRLIASRLSALGVSVHVVDFQPWGRRGGGYLDARDPIQAKSIGEFQATVAKVHSVRTPRLLPFRLAYAAQQLRSVVHRCRADLLLTMFGGSAAAIAYLSGVRPYVVYAMGSDVLMAGWPHRQIARFTLASAAVVVANGRHLAAKTLDLAADASVIPLYHGIDLAFFRSAEPRVTAPRFICSRAFFPIYDNATIIRAFGSLTHVPPNLEVSFLSTGPLVSEAIALADAVIAPGWRDQVRFVGYVAGAGMLKALQSASCYVSASLSDGTSTSLLEAMACGLFPIVSDIPANREWIVDGDNGMLFPPGDHLALTECLERAVGERVWLSSAVESNRRLVEQRANLDTNIQALSDLLSSLC